MSRHRAAPVDRISDLSDELISHILSFVPIKLAFTTTVLSKRWTKLPYSLPVPTFDDENIPYNDDDDGDIHRFCRFIDTNLSVKTFHLKSRFRFDGANRQSFDAWVEAAKQRRFEEVHLIMNNVKLNPTIFTSQTLVVLKLDKLLVEAENLHVDLPSLKTLHLKHVCFEYQNDIKKLLNACPVLEDLHTVYPRYIQREENSEEFESLFLSKLVRAEIGSTDVPFNAIHNVQFLRLHRAQDPSLMNVEEIFKDIPVFQNLIHVELWFYGFFHGWDGVVELLRHCPKLQIIFLRKWNTSLSKDWDCPILGLECVESHLRSCTILNFEGSENDLRFAKYIFQNATLLQDMTIKVAASSSDGKHQIIEELSSCPRMSSGSTLSF